MELIHFFQQFESSGLTLFFRIITFLGDENFYVLILPVILWNWDRQRSVKLLYVVMISLLLNVWLKELLQMPRPVGTALIEQGGYGFPSGHAQGTASFWILLALLTKGKLWPRLAVIMILLVGVSRLYLGVHYPIDVLGGWFFAGLVIIAYQRGEGYVTGFLKERSAYQQVLHLTALFVLLTLIMIREETLSIGGALLGFTWVYLPFRERFQTVPGSVLKGLMWTVIGIVGMLLIKEGVKLILPDMEVFRFVRYALMGSWIGLTAIKSGST